MKGGSSEHKSFEESFAFLEEVLCWLRNNTQKVAEARRAQPGGGSKIGAGINARNLALMNAVKSRQRIAFKGENLATARACVAKSKSNAADYLAALELLLLDFYVSEATYLELKEGYGKLAIKLSIVGPMPEVLTPGVEALLNSIGNDFKDVGMTAQSTLVLTALDFARGARQTRAAPEPPRATPAHSPATVVSRTAIPWLVQSFAGALPASAPKLELPRDDEPDWPTDGGANLYSCLFPSPREALELLVASFQEPPPRRDSSHDARSAGLAAAREIVCVEGALRALDIVPAAMAARKATYQRLAEGLLEQQRSQPARFDRWERRVLALHLAGSLRLSAEPDLADRGAELEDSLTGHDTAPMAFTTPELPAMPEEGDKPKRRLSRHRLLALVADEAWKDGSLDETDCKVLEKLAHWLRLPKADVRLACERAQARFGEGALGSRRKLDPIKLYAKAAYLAYEAGEPSASDESLLAGLRKLCRIDGATHESVMQSVRARVARH